MTSKKSTKREGPPTIGPDWPPKTIYNWLVGGTVRLDDLADELEAWARWARGGRAPDGRWG